MKRNLLGQPLTSDEVAMLESMAQHHHANFRPRALGLLALHEGESPKTVSKILRMSEQMVYEWARRWRERGILGILGGNVGGAPRKLTYEMLDYAAEVAKQEPMTLAKIAAKVRARYPEAKPFSEDRLSVGLHARGLSFKRTRLSLEKNGTTSISEPQSGHWQ
ncbi:helix-turn-helix domain-containing protein [Chitinibacter sp. GC72]|uniref:helix-turn-helix domain-containing protein n=1 Tax=Chitinibacter sp. GC72 TaxID=1526917 RepID=UPI0012FC21DD|nr:helix-turn-helix domain-containing protein [Chitinibacter sp. GC72]